MRTLKAVASMGIFIPHRTMDFSLQALWFRTDTDTTSLRMYSNILMHFNVPQIIHLWLCQSKSKMIYCIWEFSFFHNGKWKFCFDFDMNFNFECSSSFSFAHIAAASSVPFDRSMWFFVFMEPAFQPFAPRLPIRSYSHRSRFSLLMRFSSVRCLDPIWLKIFLHSWHVSPLSSSLLLSLSLCLCVFLPGNIKWLDDYFRFMTLMYWLRMTASKHHQL